MSFLKNFRISALFPKGGGGKEETDGFDPDACIVPKREDNPEAARALINRAFGEESNSVGGRDTGYVPEQTVIISAEEMAKIRPADLDDGGFNPEQTVIISAEEMAAFRASLQEKKDEPEP